MERLRTEQPKGLTRAGLRKWGMLFMILGVFGRSVLQTRFLGVTGLTTEELLEVMSAGPDAMLFATMAIVMQFVESCAAPIFCLMLADGFACTSDAGKYIARVLGVAALSEIPYNFAMSAKFLDLGSRNPVFGLVVCLVLLYLYRYFADNKKVTNLLIKAIGTLAALVWCVMLKIDSGVCCVILTVAFWGFRKKPMIRNLMAGAAAMVCCLFSLYYLAAPMGMLVIHFYNGEEGDENRLVNYLFYPVVLTVFAIAGYIAFGF